MSAIIVFYGCDGWLLSFLQKDTYLTEQKEMAELDSNQFSSSFFTFSFYIILYYFYFISSLLDVIYCIIFYYILHYMCIYIHIDQA